MEKYNWKPGDIDDMEVFKVVDLEFGDWREKQAVETIDTIDNILGFE